MTAENALEILLVEDNDNDAEFTLRVFKKNKLASNIVRVKDGEEALDFILAKGEYKNRNIDNKPNLILLDLKLPKVDGLEVLEKVREDERVNEIPIVMLTSSKEERDRMKSYKLGVNSYIVKPVDFSSFREAIRGIGYYWLVLNEQPHS